MKRIFLLLILLPCFVSAQDLPVKPSNYITDEADVLTNEEERVLNAKLHGFEDSTSNQIFVYTAASLNGNAIDDFSQKLFHAWHIGQAEKNNGVLITIFVDDHKFRIQTGYGLEGALPDLLTKHIQDNEMRPSFKENKYYEGIDKGVDQLIYYSKHEFKPEDIEESSAGLFIFFYAFSTVFLIITLLLTRRLKDRPTARTVITILSIFFFLIPFLGSFLTLIMVFIALSLRKDLLKSSGSSGSYYDSSSSSYSNDSSWSGSESSSGSDFSGGGGGDSGGGGSSSDW